ncbi:hypothetical protein Tco_0605584 [Tanacetum coccineum]
MSTPVFVDPEISTQADGAQSSRVPVPLLEDPYKAIRQAYLVGTDTESEPIEDLVETEAPKSRHTVASPTSLPDGTPPTFHVEESEGSDTSGVRSTSSDSTAPLSPDHPLTHTTPTLVPILCRTAHMVVLVLYESLPPLSPPDLPLRKRYQGTFELVEDDEEAEDDEEGDDEEEDEEMEESLDSNNVSEDTEEEGPTVEDKDLAMKDEGFATGDEGLETAIGEPLGLEYGALRRREIALGEGRMPSIFEVGQSSRSVPESERPEIVSALRHPTHTTWMDPEDGIVYIDVPAYPPPPLHAQTPPSPEWPSGSLPISPAPSIVPSPISSPMIPLTIPSPVALPATAKTKGFLTELGARVEMQGGLIHDHMVRLEELSPALFERSLEHEHERVVVTFGAIWRPVLALESWEGQTDAQRAAMWHTISDTQGENQELRLQLVEERHARLELDEIVDSVRGGQRPRGDV